MPEPIPSAKTILKHKHLETTSDEYQAIFEHKVPGDEVHYIRRIFYQCVSGQAYAQFWLDIRGKEIDVKDVKPENTREYNWPLDYPILLDGGESVIVYVKSDGTNTVKANARIYGRWEKRGG